MFRNKKINVIISVVVAILLWIYVVGQVNPSTTKKIPDLPVTLVGEEELGERDLAVSEVEDLKVTVTLEGKRAYLKDIKDEDVSVTAEIGGLEKGKNAVPITVTVPEDAKLSKLSAENIHVTIEDRVVEEKKVTVVFDGKFTGGQEPGNVVISPETVGVAGAASVIDKVDRVEAKVGADKEENGSIETEAVGIPVDKAGTLVEHVEPKENRVWISATLMEKKTVDLKVETEGSVGDGYQLENIKVPNRIILKGPREELEKIQVIEAKPVNIEGLTKDTTLPLEMDLPSGVEISDESEEPVAVISIRNLGVFSLQFPTKDLDVKNLGSGLNIEVEEVDVKAVLKGKKNVSDGFSLGDVLPYIDVKDLGAGPHKVKIKGTLSDKVESVIFSPSEVEIILREV